MATSFKSTFSSKMLIFLAAYFATVGFAAALPSPDVLSHDDVILLDGSGNPQIMKSSEFEYLRARDAGIFTVPPPQAVSPRSSKLTRGCEESTEVQVLTNTTVLSHDVAISPVISGQNITLASVSVAKGYSVANSVAVGVMASLATLEKILTYTLSITYTATWTTTDTQTLSFNVPPNVFGVIVSQPYVHEMSGNVITGCTDSPTVTSFNSTTYTSQSFGELSWVTGVIRLCTSTSYPIPYCIGEGFHT